VLTYVYLGVPFGKNGTIFSKYISKVTAKLESNLKMLYATGTTWSPKLRIMLVKTFVFSQLDYCMGIYSRIAVEEDLKPLEDLYNKVIQWCLSSAIPTYMDRSITGFGPFSYLADCRQAGLARHLESLAPHNPVVPILASHNAIWNPRSLSPRVKQHPWFTEYSGLPKKPKFKQFLRNKFHSCFPNSILHSYITKSSRRPNNMDTLLLWAEPTERALFLDWRLNRACFRLGYCTVCTKK
jgi:hypothetical protein